jgi:hypothetical protein
MPYAEMKRTEIAVRALEQSRKILDAAPRQGAERDVPEGSRYVVLSDSLARSLSGNLRMAEGLLIPQLF